MVEEKEEDKLFDSLVDILVNKISTSNFDIMIVDTLDLFVYTCFIVFVTSYLIFIRNMVYNERELKEEILPSSPMDKYINQKLNDSNELKSSLSDLVNVKLEKFFINAVEQNNKYCDEMVMAYDYGSHSRFEKASNAFKQHNKYLDEILDVMESQLF